MSASASGAGKSARNAYLAWLFQIGMVDGGAMRPRMLAEIYPYWRKHANQS